MIEKRKKISIKNYVLVWLGFLLVTIISPVIILSIYKLLNLNCEINIDTVFSYISGCLTFLGTTAVTLSTIYSNKKMDLMKNLNNNRILLTEGKDNEVLLRADKQNTLALMFNIYINNFMFPDEVIVKELSIISTENDEEKCVIINNNQEVMIFMYPKFNGQTLISIFMDKKAPPFAYKLINNNVKLSINVSFDMIKTNVVTSVMYCADIIKEKQPEGIYTHTLMHPPYIYTDEPHFYK